MNKILVLLFGLFLSFPSYGAVDFDGTADYLNMGTLGTFGSKVANGITISAWIQTTSETDSYIWGGRDSVATNMSFAWETNYDSGYQTNERIWVQSTDSKYLIAYVNGFDNLNDGYWHHVAFAFDPPNNTAYIYFDGESQAVSYQVQQTPATFTNLSTGLLWGAYSNSGTPASFWDGSIDDPRVYTRILNSEEIANLGLSRVRIPLTDDLHQWLRLDEYANDSSVLNSLFPDYSGNSLTGTAGGSVSVVIVGSELTYP